MHLSISGLKNLGCGSISIAVFSFIVQIQMNMYNLTFPIDLTHESTLNSVQYSDWLHVDCSKCRVSTQ